MPPQEINPPPRKQRRRRCIYCDELFPIPATHPKKKFCSDAHRIAYHHEGLALGPLREKLPKWITKEVAKQLAEAKTELVYLIEKRVMAALDIPELEARIISARLRHEAEPPSKVRLASAATGGV